MAINSTTISKEKVLPQSEALLNVDNGALVAARTPISLPDPVEPPKEVDPGKERTIISDETARKDDAKNEETLKEIEQERKDAQERAKERVAEAFATDPEGLTKPQKKAFGEVQEAFSAEEMDSAIADPNSGVDERDFEEDGEGGFKLTDEATGREFKDAFGNTRIADGTLRGRPKTHADRTVFDEAESEDAKLAREEEEIKAQLEASRVNANEQNDALIQAIQQKYEVRRNDMRKVNESRVEQVEQIGFRLGTARFAPQINQGILSTEERAGINRMAQLDAEEAQLIASAKLAAQSQNYAMLSDQLASVEAKRSERQKLLEQQNKLAVEQDAKIKEQLFRSTRDNVIGSLFSQGVTDVAEMLDLINFDDKGNIVGDFTAEEIADTLDRFTTDAVKSPDTQIVKLDNGNTILVNKNTGDTIKEFGGFNVSNIGGNRDDLSAFQLLEAANLAIQIFGKRGGNEPANRGLVEDLMVRGMTADDIQDELRFSGQSEAFSGNYKQAFEFVTKSKFTTADREAARDGLDELLQDGDTAGATEFILGLARDKANAETKKQIDGRIDLLSAIDSIEVGLKYLEEQGVSTGPLTGLNQAALEAGGIHVGNAEQNAVANEIAIAIIDYRKAVSGAAFTESEAEAYNKVFPSIGKTKELNQSKINSIRSIGNRKLDDFYKRELGSGYEAIIGGAPAEEKEETVSLEAAQEGDIVEIGGVRYKTLSDGTFTDEF